jgi:hypothetical protein
MKKQSLPFDVSNLRLGTGTGRKYSKLQSAFVSQLPAFLFRKKDKILLFGYIHPF